MLQLQHLSKLAFNALHLGRESLPPSPPPFCRFPVEIILQVFDSVEDGECPGCSLCRLEFLFRCCLVSRAVNGVATKLLYRSLDLTFNTEVRVDRVPPRGQRSYALELGVMRSPFLMEKAYQRQERKGGAYITDCPAHFRLFKQRDAGFAFREQERILALLLRTLNARSSPVPLLVRHLRLPIKWQYPWGLGSNTETAHPFAARIIPALVDIVGRLHTVETITNLGDLSTFVAITPGLATLQHAILAAVATNDRIAAWDWAEHHNPNMTRYLDHLGTNTAPKFLALHEGWANLRHLALGTTLLQQSLRSAFPFHHLPALRSLSLAGTHSFSALFAALPANQLSTLTILPGTYGEHASRPLIAYLRRHPPRTPQRLTTLTMRAAIDDTRSTLLEFRLDHFLSNLLTLAPHLISLHLALVPRSCIPPKHLLDLPFTSEPPLHKLYASGLRLRELTLVASAHDWSWLPTSIHSGGFPALMNVAITRAQWTEGMAESDMAGPLTPLHGYEPPPRKLESVRKVQREERFLEMDEELVEAVEGRKGCWGRVRFVEDEEEEEMLVVRRGGYV